MPVSKPLIKKARVEAKYAGGLAVKCIIGRHTLIQDLPESAGGKDLGPAPTELILASLAGCLGIVAAYHAPSFGIDLQDMDMSVEGEYDARGFLGEEVKPGFIKVKAEVTFHSKHTPKEKLVEFMKFVEKHCPISDTLKSDVDIKIELKN